MLRILYLDTTFMLPRRSIREGRVGQKCLTLLFFVNIGTGGIMSEKIVGVLCVVGSAVVILWIIGLVISEVCK